MNRLILCEGKTDAILLSYYLEHTCNWRHCKAPVTLNIKADETRGESAYWYQKDTEKLLICGVGGKDNFYRFFREKILSAMIDSSAFSKIAIVTDRDNQVEASICASFQSVCSPVITNITVNTWVSNAYQNSFGQDIEVNFLLVIVPKDKEGALETLLLDAISEDVNDKIIVEKSKAYIQNIEPFAKKYMSKTRLKLKACLGVTWAIQYPEKIFSFIDEQIRTVKWEESQSLHECFEQLKKI
jgi:hypothetical protein